MVAFNPDSRSFDDILYEEGIRFRQSIFQKTGIRTFMRAGKKNILILCPQEKIRNIHSLRYDVEGLPGNFFGKYIRVITGYDRFQMLPVS